MLRNSSIPQGKTSRPDGLVEITMKALDSQSSISARMARRCRCRPAETATPGTTHSLLAPFNLPNGLGHLVAKAHNQSAHVCHVLAFSRTQVRRILKVCHTQTPPASRLLALPRSTTVRSSALSISRT